MNIMFFCDAHRDKFPESNIQMKRMKESQRSGAEWLFNIGRQKRRLAKHKIISVPLSTNGESLNPQNGNSVPWGKTVPTTCEGVCISLPLPKYIRQSNYATNIVALISYLKETTLDCQKTSLLVASQEWEKGCEYPASF